MESEIVEPTKETILNISANETHEECKSINLGSPVGELAGGDQEEERDGGGGGDFTIDVKHEEDDILKEEIICRICHLSNCFNDSIATAQELIELGCDCRGELGMSHLYCAQTWFNHRGNRGCEICGAMAKNVTITKKETRIWIVNFEPTTLAGNSFAAVAASSRGNSTSSSSSRRTTRMCKQNCCNLVLVCIVLGLVTPWFFGIKFF